MTPTIQVRASRDQATKLATVLVLIVIVVATASLLSAALSSTSVGTRTLLLVVAALPIIVILGCAAFVPLRYRIADDAVWIDRPLRSAQIPLRAIRSVRPIELHGVIRAMGVGGFFGAWGWFTSRELPAFRAYVTKRRGLVCIELRQGDPVVLSPDDPAAFIDEIQRRLPA